MEIKSLAYIGFCLLVIVLYFFASKRQRLQRDILLAANVFFIWTVCGLKSSLLLLFYSSLIYILGRVIGRHIENKNKAGAQAFMWGGIIFCVAFLCYFKFFNASFEALREILLGHFDIGSLITPVGMSYVTLSFIAYLWDVCHKKHKAEENYFDFLAFSTYFPSIVEGPVNLYKKLSPQLKEAHSFDYDRAAFGLMRLVWGYIKKMVIADRIGILVSGVLKDERATGFIVFYVMILYSFQIYTDFSGGIDVIMGISEILGIKLAENFNAPLISKSVTEYWQRWHMSLGEFMEKYIYYQLALHRQVMAFSKKLPFKYLQKIFAATFASVVVFVIVGIWHGTGWNYVVYGAYQALFVSSAIFMLPVYKWLKNTFRVKEETPGYRIFMSLRTFFILVIGRYFIRAKDLGQTFELLKRTFVSFNPHAVFDGSLLEYGLDLKNIYIMYIGILIVIIIDILHGNKFKIREAIGRCDIAVRVVIYMLAIFSIIIFGIYGPGFSAASFIYQEF